MNHVEESVTHRCHDFNIISAADYTPCSTVNAQVSGERYLSTEGLKADRRHDGALVWQRPPGAAKVLLGMTVDFKTRIPVVSLTGQIVAEENTLRRSGSFEDLLEVGILPDPMLDRFGILQGFHPFLNGGTSRVPFQAMYRPYIMLQLSGWPRSNRLPGVY
jgi:hypothetical protein